MKSGMPGSSASAGNRGSSKWVSTLRHWRCVPRIAGVSVYRLPRRDRFLQVAIRAGLRNSRNSTPTLQTRARPDTNGSIPIAYPDGAGDLHRNVISYCILRNAGFPMANEFVEPISPRCGQMATQRIIAATTLYAVDILIYFPTAATLQAPAACAPIRPLPDGAAWHASRTNHPARPASVAAVVQ